MSQNKELLRRRLTFRQRRLLRRAYQAWCDTTMFLNLRFWLNAARIQDYHDIHKGERCFIIGNGPSLNQTNLSLLKREYTFGLNRIYLAFDRLGPSTTYYVSVNDLVLRQCATEIESLSCPKFVSWKNRSLFQRRRDIMFLRRLPIPAFSTDIAYGIWEGSTVTYVAMQIAFFMGFRQVILVGVDHHFDTKGPAHHEVVSEGADLNHFDPDQQHR